MSSENGFFRVLVTGAGTGSAVSVIKSLKRQNEIPLEIIAVDSDPLSAGLFLADFGHEIPNVDEPDYIRKLIDICKKYEVTVIFPTFSKEILEISKKQSLLRENGIESLLPKPEVIAKCDNKRDMYDFVSNLGIPVPKEFDVKDFESARIGGLEFPLFVKPNISSGSKGVNLVNNFGELEIIPFVEEDYILQEYFPGPEYTVDVLVDEEHKLLVASPRVRLSVKAGQMVKGETREIPILREYCELICKEIGAVGPGNIQFFEDRGSFIFSEYNPRFAAGGLMLTIEAGADIPLLALKLCLGIKAVPEKLKHNLTMIRYYEEVFSSRE